MRIVAFPHFRISAFPHSRIPAFPPGFGPVGGWSAGACVCKGLLGKPVCGFGASGQERVWNGMQQATFQHGAAMAAVMTRCLKRRIPPMPALLCLPAVLKLCTSAKADLGVRFAVRGVPCGVLFVNATVNAAPLGRLLASGREGVCYNRALCCTALHWRWRVVVAQCPPRPYPPYPRIAAQAVLPHATVSRS